ncbi:MAG: cation diffusion facilitator family transporter [Gammaproteobacteria bacterium]|nr:MAG: cation diffusion facilitator family transporter [Gammaproteobacteria bacterium]TND06447.1 MAG: cation diffusion facilitator family transporter [Gammaproteobacteria bacterium]
MHIDNLDQWQHVHHFHIEGTHGERNTRRVIALTLTMMIIEIGAGTAFGSMALLADGWHMGTHAAALGITAFAYAYARRHKDNPRYSFGTGKVGVLGGFASAVALAVIALVMALESVHRFFVPVEIHFNQAIGVAVVGLIVNIVSAVMLHAGDDHDHHHHEHDDHDDHDHRHHRDHNLRAAYLHVIADALTSVLAIVALLTGKMLGWVWMDPMMGIVGAILITRWSIGLMRDTSGVLLDNASDKKIAAIKAAIEADADNRVTDLHIWQVGSHRFAAIVSVVTHFPQAPEYYKRLLSPFDELEHLSIEVNHAHGEPCLTA